MHFLEKFPVVLFHKYVSQLVENSISNIKVMGLILKEYTY